MRPAAEDAEDVLAAYLPAILRQDPFMADFLRIFDAQLRPLLQMLDALDCYFDPDLTPPELLPWLAGWVGEDSTDVKKVSSTRSLIKEAAAIHRSRGTRKGLKRAIELVGGHEALITENTSGLRLDADAKLGINTSLQDADPNNIHIVILADGGGVDLEAVTEVAEKLRPAHAAFTIRVTNE
jgi:phage tail-like protein